MNCALCIVHADNTVPAVTILNGHAVCATHVKDVIAAPGARGVTVSRMREDSPLICQCGHHRRVHTDGTSCAAGIGNGDICDCRYWVARVITPKPFPFPGNLIKDFPVHPVR